jgi:hypothetical protein
VSTPWERRIAFCRAFLTERLERHPFLAEAPTGTVRPDRYPRDVVQCSACLREGSRVWAFAREADRDAFLRSYPLARELKELPE